MPNWGGFYSLKLARGESRVSLFHQGSDLYILRNPDIWLQLILLLKHHRLKAWQNGGRPYKIFISVIFSEIRFQPQKTLKLCWARFTGNSSIFIRPLTDLRRFVFQILLNQSLQNMNKVSSMEVPQWYRQD